MTIRILSRVLAVAVGMLMLGCSSIPARHYSVGIGYSKEARQRGESIDELKERVRLLKLAEAEHEAGSTGFWFARREAHKNSEALQKTRRKIGKTQAQIVELEEEKARREERRKSLLAALERSRDHYPTFYTTFQSFGTEFWFDPKLPELRDRLHELRKDWQQRAEERIAGYPLALLRTSRRRPARWRDPSLACLKGAASLGNRGDSPPDWGVPVGTHRKPAGSGR